MRKILLIAILCYSFNTFSQVNNEVDINGQIIVEGNDIEGIAIYNKSTKIGAISDAKGEFNLNVKLNDTIEVRAIQYQDFNIIVNDAILQSKRMKIYLIEEVNQLDEIVIRNKPLTGDLGTDANSIKTFKPRYDAIYFGVRQEPIANESPSEFTRSDIEITNVTSQNKPLVNGLNIINVVDQLLIPLFRSEVQNKKEIGVSEVPAKSIKYFFGSEFIAYNFNVPKHRIEEFIRFIEDEKFDYNLLNYGKELELLEVINIKSKLFLNSSSEN